jgi:hypothetical protein
METVMTNKQIADAFMADALNRIAMKVGDRGDFAERCRDVSAMPKLSPDKIGDIAQRVQDEIVRVRDKYVFRLRRVGYEIE